jgi:pectinesterase
MIGKVAVSVTSVILVVGVALAVALVVHHNASKNNAESLSPQMKMVKEICSKTDFLDACQKSLSPVAEKGNTDPKEFIKAAIQATINEVAKSANFSDMLVQNASNIPRVKMAAEDCKELMSFSIDELQASFTMVGDSDMHTMNDRADELKNWLSAAISYQQTCLDGFEAPDYHKLMEQNLNDAALLTSNALAIVSELADILKVFGLEFNIKPPGRRLLSQDGYVRVRFKCYHIVSKNHAL